MTVQTEPQRRINIPLPDSIHKQIRHDAIERNVSMAAVISATLSQYYSTKSDNHGKA